VYGIRIGAHARTHLCNRVKRRHAVYGEHVRQAAKQLRRAGGHIAADEQATERQHLLRLQEAHLCFQRPIIKLAHVVR
jgi:hypothetical protein